MPSFRLAHLREQGQDMRIFPLNSQIHQKSDSEQTDLLDELELRANNAGLAGSAVLCWQHGGSFYFVGPRAWHPFLKSINLSFVQANVNREISW